MEYICDRRRGWATVSFTCPVIECSEPVGSQISFVGQRPSADFADGSAQAKGYALPYPNFVADFGGSGNGGAIAGSLPQYTKIFNNFEGSGTTYYQGMQVQVEKRFTNGLSFLAGYTLPGNTTTPAADSAASPVERRGWP